MKLEGIRVLDLSLFLPGPLLTQMMADHGAEVIKLEPLSGEPNRQIGEKRDGMTVYFANTHRGKKSVQLNLKTDEGKEALMRLVETCDVMVEAFRPGVVKRLGCDYETVSKRNPKLVYISISAFGQDGPYVKKPAHDLATEALAGALSLNEGRDGKPAIPGIANADMLSSMMGLSGVLMALLRRQTTGKGDYIDLAMMDSLFAAMPNLMGTTFAEKRPPKPKEERTGGGYAFYDIYETKDGKFVVLGASEMHFAENVMKKFGRPDLIEACQPPPGPTQEPAKAFLRETFRTKTRAEWVEWFDGVDAAFAPVNSLREGCDDPQVRHRGMIFEDERGWEHIGVPIRFADEPGGPTLTWAEMGEHTAETLKSLGYGDDEIAAMKNAGVF
ncbi:MAG: CaiB/BaiF CoA transferase family protein [Minwuia sp.]|uniref:CaiB/BaiF CoA transferase family protein n=1 Tax=Minwuia sp. TaxID=2493630 RepID=UPI003A8AB855